MRTALEPSESQIQRALISWWAYAHKGLGVANEARLFAVPNGGSRNMIEAVKMKAEGVRPGSPDLLLLVPRGGYHGLAIEMKKPGGKKRPEQITTIAELNADGYIALFCFSFEEAQAAITTYLTHATTRIRSREVCMRAGAEHTTP